MTDQHFGWMPGDFCETDERSDGVVALVDGLVWVHWPGGHTCGHEPDELRPMVDPPPSAH